MIDKYPEEKITRNVGGRCQAEKKEEKDETQKSIHRHFQEQKRCPAIPD